MARFVLQRVHYMPTERAPGILYVSEEFRIALHLCACGCGAKIKTPLGPTEWSIVETERGPSVWPSIGNWQQSCQSHYVISHGEVKWAGKWTPEQIAAGRRSEEERRQAHYDAWYRKNRGLWGRFWDAVKAFLHL